MLINGKVCENIKSSRGIREDDPLSPYLFLLCAEELSGLLTKIKEFDKIKGLVAVRNGLMVSHLLFVDDSMLFYKADKEECQELLRVPKLYEQAFGQQMNMDKPSVLFKFKHKG